MDYGKIVVLKNVEGETVVEVVSLDKELDLDIMHKYADCNTIDIKMAMYRGLDFRASLIFDDEFLLKANPVANKIASLFYGYGLEHFEVLCGDVIIAKDIDTEDGEVCVGLNDEEVKQLMHCIEECRVIQNFLPFKVQEPCFEIYFD